MLAIIIYRNAGDCNLQKFRRLFNTDTHYKTRNGVPGTWPAYDQHMTAHDDDDNDDDVNDDDDVGNVDT